MALTDMFLEIKDSGTSDADKHADARGYTHRFKLFCPPLAEIGLYRRLP